MNIMEQEINKRSNILKLWLKYRDLVVYAFCGGVSTIINILVYHILANLLNFYYLIANLIAWVVAVGVAYVLNKYWVFHSKTNSRRRLLAELLAFVGCRFFSGIFDMAGMYVGISILKLNDMFIKIVINVIVILINYVLSKYWIFRRKKR